MKYNAVGQNRVEIGYALVSSIFASAKPKLISMKTILGKRYLTPPIGPWLEKDGLKHASLQITKKTQNGISKSVSVKNADG